MVKGGSHMMDTGYRRAPLASLGSASSISSSKSASVPLTAGLRQARGFVRPQTSCLCWASCTMQAGENMLHISG